MAQAKQKQDEQTQQNPDEGQGGEETQAAQGSGSGFQVQTWQNNRTGETFTVRVGSVAERRVMRKLRGKQIDEQGTPLVQPVGKPKTVQARSRAERRRERRQRQRSQAQGQGS